MQNIPKFQWSILALKPSPELRKVTKKYLYAAFSANFHFKNKRHAVHKA